MSDILCVTNRLLCRDAFLPRLEQIAANRPAGIILREKDLSETEYKALAERVMSICKAYHIPCILHNFVGAAIALQAEAIHLPLPVLRTLSDDQKACFHCIGASCHSVEEARQAQALGCRYITAGHIFATDCKRGLPGRGLAFLKSICESVSIPVYAIGGIDRSNIASVRGSGAHGACIMRGLMQCEDISAYLNGLEKEGKTDVL